jgi:Pyruvate/2-oxoacid:ferredoxin oxidoreductase delta subunit
MSSWESLDKGQEYIPSPQSAVPTPKEVYERLAKQENDIQTLRREVRETFSSAELASGRKRRGRKSAAQTPAPKKDQVKGSKKNPEGSASGGKKITFDERTETALKKKVEDHNKKASKGRKATLTMLKAVYRRGAGAYSTSHRPGKTRSQWAMARVNAFLRLLLSGKPSKASYTQDNDLLPAGHPRSSKKKASSLTASALVPEEQALADALISVVETHGKFDQDGTGVWAGYTPALENEDAQIGVKCANCVFYSPDNQCRIVALEVEPEAKCRFAVIPDHLVQGYSPDLKGLMASVDEFVAESELTIDASLIEDSETVEDVILGLTELSGLGYDSEYAFRASWLRAIRNGEDPYKRAHMLATMTYDSLDADLLPKRGDSE